MPLNESLEVDNNLSIFPLVHDIQRFLAIIVCTDFIKNTTLGDVKVLVLKRFPKDKLHFETIQGPISKSFNKPKFRRVLKHSFCSIFFDLRSHNGEVIPFFHLDTPTYLSFSGGCRNSDLDYFSILFLPKTITE